MNVSVDKCIASGCGNRNRPTDLESPSENLKPDGEFLGVPYWFCSVKCYKKEVSKYFENSEFKFDTQPQDDDRYMTEWLRIQNEYEDKTYGGFLANLFNPIAWKPKEHFTGPLKNRALDDFEFRKSNAIFAAEVELSNRLRAEWLAQIKKDDEAREKEDAKRTEKLIKELDKRKEREAEREAERMEEEARLEMLEPRDIPFNYYFDHQHVIAGSGHGKSTLLIRQFLEFLNMEDHPALVVIDPKGTMCEQLRRLRCFQLNDNDWIKSMGIVDHMLIIDPTLFPPALNMFAPPKRKYAPNIAQQLENNAISLFQYVFSSKGSALTDKQLTCFSFAVSLVLTIPDATIHTFLDLMNDAPIPKVGGIKPDSRFKPFIDKLGPTSKRFFYDSFYNPTEYGSTKDQISSRIYGMLRYPTFDAMFGTKDNKLDMFACLQKGKIVLISSPKSILGTEGSQLFSRYMVALTLQAAFERITVDKKKWHPAFLIIDEAQDVIDEIKTPELLEQAREFKLGVTISHQNIKGQLSDALYSSISANTRIKYAGTRSYQDASMMARDMHCEPQFIMQQKIGSFACSVGGMTEHPFVAQLKLGEIDDYEKMNASEFDTLQAILNQEYGIDPNSREGPSGSTPEPHDGTLSVPPGKADTKIMPQDKSDPSKRAKWTRK